MIARSGAGCLAVAVLACLVTGGAGADDGVAAVEAARTALLAHVDDARRVLGRDVANDVILRLADDLQTPEQPPGFSQAEWDQRVATIRTLDVSLVNQVLAGRPAPLDAVHGLAETLVRSGADGTLQPVAVYVPPGLATTRGVPVVVALHGRPQSETELLSWPYLRALADASHAVVVAPWGRGLYDFAEPAASDVYGLLDRVSDDLGTDRHRAYLLGYSMGGFSVYKVAPLHAERWAAVMSIAGSVLNSETFTVLFRLRDTPVYLVTGSEDEAVPARYGEETAAYLRGAGLAVSFYEQEGGHHGLRSLVPALTSAWDDMFAGRVRTDDSRSGPSAPHGPSGTTPSTKT